MSYSWYWKLSVLLYKYRIERNTVTQKYQIRMISITKNVIYSFGAKDTIISRNIAWTMIKLLPKLFSHEKSLRVKRGAQQEKWNYSDIRDLVTNTHTWKMTVHVSKTWIKHTNLYQIVNHMQKKLNASVMRYRYL